MSSTYRETLHRWAAQHIPEGATVTGVEIEYSEGHVWSEWTVDSAYLYVTIKYALNGQSGSVLEDEEGAAKLLTGMGALLTELFAIEETS